MDIQKLLTVDPLYTEIEINEQLAQQVVEVEFFDRTVDCFCISCGKETAFLSDPSYPQIVVTGHARTVKSTHELIQALRTNNATAHVIDRPYAPVKGYP